MDVGQIFGPIIVAGIGAILYNLRSIQAPVIVKHQETAVAPKEDTVKVPPVHQVLAKNEKGEWEGTGHVRKDSPAWQEALNTPGLALKDENGKVIEGVQ